MTIIDPSLCHCVRLWILLKKKCTISCTIGDLDPKSSTIQMIPNALAAFTAHARDNSQYHDEHQHRFVLQVLSR